jgi:Heliorhodopsin
MQEAPQQFQSTNAQNGQNNGDVPTGVLYQFVGIKPTFEFIYILNFATAFIHALSAIIVGAMALNIKTDSTHTTISPYLPAVCFDSFHAGSPPKFRQEIEYVVDTKLYLAAIVVTFFTLSACFQCAQGLNKTAYMNRITTNGANQLRYIEYSISASLMMVAIACVLLIFDIFTHVLVFTCTFSCMILGLFADYIRVLRGSLLKITKVNNITVAVDETSTIENCILHLQQLKKATHIMGWVTVFVPYCVVFFVSYFRSTLHMWGCMQDTSLEIPNTPIFVHMIIFIQFLLFNAFGAVQTFQFYQETDELILDPDTTGVEALGLRTEHHFVILSLVAKSILGWLIAANIIFV